MLSHKGSKSVVVVHFQGCLLLRLVLEDLIVQGGELFHKKMKRLLYVFTFGNPSIHWGLEQQPAQLPELEDLVLHSYSRVTEFCK